MIIEFKKYKFMNEKFTSNNIENDDLNLNTEESYYTKLITRLKEIKSTIVLLKNRYLDKF